MVSAGIRITDGALRDALAEAAKLAGTSRQRLAEEGIRRIVDEVLARRDGPAGIVLTGAPQRMPGAPGYMQPARRQFASDELAVESIRAKNQPVNVEDFGVRVTHLPTQVFVEAVDGDSRLANMTAALDALADRLSAPIIDTPRPLKTDVSRETPDAHLTAEGMVGRLEVDRAGGVRPHYHRYTTPVGGERYDQGQRRLEMECSCGNRAWVKAR